MMALMDVVEWIASRRGVAAAAFEKAKVRQMERDVSSRYVQKCSILIG